MTHGDAETRFTDVKRTYPKPINISANVLLDRERCVLCARCTRFSEQVAGDPFIALIERGALQQVGIYEKEPFQSYFSGNTIQICPVGALTSAAYRFRSRPFDLVSTPSIAEHDACGSAIRVDTRRGQVMRRLAGDDPEVNEEWITDKDRFAFAYGRGDDRLTRPLVRETDRRPASRCCGRRPGRRPSTSRSVVCSGPSMRSAGVRGSSPCRWVGVLTGGRLTVEDAYALRQVRAGRARHQQHRLPLPAAQRRGGGLPGRRGGRHRATRSTARASPTPTWSRRRRCCWSVSSRRRRPGGLFLRLRKAFRKKRSADRDGRAVPEHRRLQDGRPVDPTVPGGRGGRSGAERLRRCKLGSRFGDPGRRAGRRLLGDAERLPAAGRADRGATCLGAPARRGPWRGRGRLPAQPVARWPPGGRSGRPHRRGRDLGCRYAAVAARPGRRRDPDLGQRRRAGGAGRRRRRPERLPRSRGRAGGSGGDRLRRQPGDPGLAGHRAGRRGAAGVADAGARRALPQLGGPRSGRSRSSSPTRRP